MSNDITFKPSPKQFRAWEYLTDHHTTELGYGGAAHGGKSYLGSFFLLAMCIAYPDTGWLMGRKELSNLKKTTLLTFYKVCQDYGIEPDVHFTYNQQTNIITFTNSSQIFLFDLDYKPSDPLYTRLGGLELTGAFVDESNEIPVAAINVLTTRLGRRNNEKYGLLPKLLEGFNPDKGHVYARYYKPARDNALPQHRNFIKALPTDNPYTSENYLQQLQNADKVTKERLLYGNFEYDDDPSALIDYDAIIDLFTNTALPSQDRYMVVDAARFGGDRIQITCWQGLHLYRRVTKVMQGLDKTEADIQSISEEERIPRSHILVDEDGIGGGIVDHLKGVKGFTANQRAFPNKVSGEPENFDSLKSQCAYKLAELVNLHQVAVTEGSEEEKQLLIEELEQIKSRDADKDGKRKIIPKEEVKEKIGRSPDYSDCLLMRMYFELIKRIVINIPTTVQGGVKPYYT
jgi:phage terminase large subunit